eukprot:scaffold116113_cov22-Tisochrysis_lutea.AAC.1
MTTSAVTVMSDCHNAHKCRLDLSCRHGDQECHLWAYMGLNAWPEKLPETAGSSQIYTSLFM